ncbi:MAG: hypothetical protein ABL933_01030 [Methyloglobulus sp.]|nr:hypothetical protein [Methyloglobulus sp.]
MKLNTHLSLIACFLALFLTNTPVSAARYYFSQNLTENGRINGYFDGEDNQDFDGKITIQDYNDYYEVTDFHITYSGNSFLNSLNCSNSNDCGNSLQEFEYDIAGNNLHLLNYGYKNQNNGNWNIDFTSGTFQGGNALWAAFFLGGGGSPTQAMEFAATSPLVVSQTPIATTPLPGSLILFIPPFFLLVLIRQKKVAWKSQNTMHRCF